MLYTLAIVLVLLLAPVSLAQLRFEVSFPAERSAAPLDGRLLVMLSTSDEGEPRFEIRDGPNTQQAFGIDVEGLAPGAVAVVEGDVLGYPRASLADIPAGRYRVQALLHRYETFHRGEGQRWNRGPGNLYSTPRMVTIDPSSGTPIRLELDEEIPPIEPPADTAFIKHVRIQSKLLTEFWGRPMHLGACVLIPRGFDEHPEARYPLVINHGHFPHTFGGFRETPPDPDLEPEYSERFSVDGYNITQQEHAYQLYKDWISPDFPRMVIIEVQHANPFYDDSYAVNSQNVGPYGDAIMHELVPYIEEQFRCIGEGWARFTYGGSTGGWEALAVQVMYPDDFNGCFAACPDPIDFRAYTVVNIYDDDNAYFVNGPWRRTLRPGHRDG
ncbi:MAG: alpha/beta hydrolase-fold protein, partial [Planctomycetota bacterium]